jgi:signal transduction histidine kinase
MKFPMRPKSSSTIRFQLACLVLAAVLPVWLVSGFLVFHAYTAKRDQVNTAMLETARSLTMVVDRELSSVQAALVALATSPGFASGDFAAVQAQVMQLLQFYPGADIIVADATGQQLVNSARPFGIPLPRRNNPETVRRIFATGKPVISDLFFGSLTKRPLISIDVPVLKDGKVLYDLAMTFPSDRLDAVLRQQRLAPGCYSVILDSTSVVVARSRYPERYVGKRANPLHLALKRLPEGSAEYTNVEGTVALATFCRSTMSHWSVVIGVPKANVLAEIYRWTAWAVAGSGLISLFGMLLALRFARRITRAIRSLVDPATAIGRGEMVAAFDSHGVEEIGAVAAALVQASDLLQARSGELTRSLTSLEREITERKLAEERLQATLSELSRSNLELEQFAYVASHDLQEPLRMVSSYTQLLAQRYEGELDDKAKKFIDYAVDGAVRMQRLINDLLAYSRVGRQGKAPEATDSRLPLDEALQNLALAIELSGASVVAEELPTVRVDASQLGQLFQNLIGNAIKFRGAEAPMIRISTCDLGREWRFSVRDNGIGIEAQYAEKVFAIFQRLHARLEYPGTGIGLAICKRIVERHLGRIWFESELGQGATFHFTLPK